MSIQVIKSEPDNETESNDETDESAEEARIQKMWTQTPSFTKPIPSLFKIKQGEIWSYKLPTIK